MSLRGRLATAFLPPPDEEDGAEPLSERGWQATVVGMHVISAGQNWSADLIRTGSGRQSGRRSARVSSQVVKTGEMVRLSRS